VSSRIGVEILYGEVVTTQLITDGHGEVVGSIIYRYLWSSAITGGL